MRLTKCSAIPPNAKSTMSWGQTGAPALTSVRHLDGTFPADADTAVVDRTVRNLNFISVGQDLAIFSSNCLARWGAAGLEMLPVSADAERLPMKNWRLNVAEISKGISW